MLACRLLKHVAHDVPIIILTSPDIASLRLHNAGNRIVNQGIEILNSQLFEPVFVFRVINLLKNILKGMIILFGVSW